MQLEGRFEWRTDATTRELHGDVVCFVPDAGSALRLPRPVGDARLAFFCFHDALLARRRLGLPQNPDAAHCGLAGRAVVVVRRYRPSRPDVGDVDRAQLVSARITRRAMPLSCTP